MAKYRIIEVNNLGKVHYEIEKKGLFFWNVEGEEDYDDIGSYTKAYKYDSVEEAEKYVRKKNWNQTKTTIKTLIV